MNQNKTLAAIIVGGLVLILGLFSVFIVDEREKVILLRLGKIQSTDFDAGLHFKIPFINNVRKFDGRILTMDAEPESFLTAEKKNVLVDAFVKWRIDDVAKYYTTMRGSEREANLRLSQIVINGLRDEFGKRTIKELVSGDRADIMSILTKTTGDGVAEFGMVVVDVRIKRIDLKGDISVAVFQRMEAERTRVAKELRSQGAEAKERIQADADRQTTVIVANAYSEAEQLRGNGDAEASEIYAQAYQKNPEFYAFYRSLGAYRRSFANKQDLMVFQPDSEFFNYFGNKGAVSSPAPVAAERSSVKSGMAVE